MRYKFDKIVIAYIRAFSLVPEQRKHVTFDAFFENADVPRGAHACIKQTINGKGDVQSATKETYSAMEEGNNARRWVSKMVEQLERRCMS